MQRIGQGFLRFLARDFLGLCGDCGDAIRQEVSDNSNNTKTGN